MLTILALATLHLDCAALQRTATFEVRPGLPATLTQTAEDRFRLRTGPHALEVAGDCNPDFGMGALVADFNFDGWRDVAVPTGTGYGGVNTFYTLYFYRPQRRTLEKTRFADELNALDIRANLVPDAGTRTVDASYKSGPAYASVTLCLTPDGLDLYTCRVGAVGNSTLAGAPDDVDWTWYGPRGQVLASRPLRRSGEDRSLWTVAVPRLFLRPSPSLSSVARSYVIRGDRVEVLELRGAWAHVVYSRRSGQVFSGWVPGSALR